MTSPQRSTEPSPTLRLSDLLGRDAVDGDGHRLGSLADLLVTLRESHPEVVGVELGDRRERRTIDSAGLAADGTLQLRGGGDPPLGEPVLRLARDVLDAQMVDVEGHRLVRVGDIELAARPGELRAVAVDVGLGAVLRRLGMRGLAERAPRDAIDWAQLHIASGPGHALQLASPAAAIHRLDADGLAALVARLPPARGAEVLRAVAPEHAGAARQRARHQRRPHRFPHASRRRART